MRYDTPVYFQKVKSGEYDPMTGNYKDDTVEETMVMASVMDTRTETMKLVYGSIKQGSLTVHMQNHYRGDFDFIRVGEKRYKVDYGRYLRVKQSMVLSEVQ